MQEGEGPGRGSIAILGAPASGKTTFLAALGTALLQHEPSWRLVGEDSSSAQALVRLMSLIIEGGGFPSATGDLQNFRWSLVGPVQGARPRFARRRRPEEVMIGLDMIDAPGAMATEESVFRESGRLIDNVASSEGLLFLYDPVMEYDRGGSFNYAYSVLAAMARNVSQPGVRLPHYVAVCITKFDEPPVLAAAERLRMIEFDREPPYFPRVPDGLAQDFFREICRASRSDDASLFLPLLTQTFNSDRIRFFVTSAIGFYVDPATGVYDPGDFQNVIRGRLDTRIRGSVHPINVVEPLLWLGRQIASDRGLRKRNGHAEAR